MAPGIHPRQERINTIRKEPHPLSTTANGGKIMHKMTLPRLINN